MFEKYLSRKLTLAILLLSLLLSLSLSACGGEPAADVTMPTPVLTYTPAAAISAAASAAVDAVTPTAAPTEPPTSTPLPTATSEPTIAPTATPPVEPTSTPAPTVTPTPEIEATATATIVPSETPTAAPTDVPATAVATSTAAFTPTVEAGAPSVAITATVAVDTDALTATAPMSDSVVVDLLPAEVASALVDANPARGQELTVANGCIACHALGEGQLLVGPSWFGVGSRAATRVAGESGEEYLYRSIVAPNDYLVEGFAAGIMPPIYGDTIAPPDLADIISYLLSLQ